MLWNLKALLGLTASAAGIHMDQISCERAFADGFHDEPCMQYYGVQYLQTGNKIVLTPWNDVKKHNLLSDRMDTKG